MTASMWRRIILGVAASLGAVAVTGCGFSNEASYRIRMTVELDTPDGGKTGTSVSEIVARKQEKFVSEARPLISEVQGQAVVVNTSSGPIFVLLKLPRSDKTYIQAVTFALAPDLRDGGWEPFWKAVKRLGGWSGNATAELPRDDWPIMVRFANLKDPTTVEAVDPEGVGVKRINLETTSDPVTTGLPKMLTWLVDEGSTLNQKSGPTVSPTLAQTLRQRDFSTELRRGK